MYAAYKLSDVLPDLLRERMIGYGLEGKVDLNIEALAAAGFAPDGSLWVERIFAKVQKS